MIAVLRNALILSLAVLMGLVGMVESVRGGSQDLAVVFGIVVLLQVVVLIGLRVGRRPTSLRADLATWVDEHAAATGEPVQRVTDRCVAAYRAGLVADHRDQP